ncbi:MAG TPA: NAD(P)/FAD-dependent oxidoreductase [Halobacteriales archaeon]|jgi:thioredoxin reductase (NADPH)|nr:NAD(P)/FAD-dependent oxidoreductase [Halobacteriales archaeon]
MTVYDVIVIGGGPGGLSTAMYTTRLGFNTAIINRGGGRAAMMRNTHNVIGVLESVSGNEYLSTSIEQLQDYGVTYLKEFVTSITPLSTPDSISFQVQTESETHTASRVVLATGFKDVPPKPPLPRTGRGLHYCLHCDAHMFKDKSTYVMGHGPSAAHVAMTLLNFTDEVDLLLRGENPTWDDNLDQQLRSHPIDIIKEDISSIENNSDGWLQALVFEDGIRREYHGGFAMYGSEYNNKLAIDLGCELDKKGQIKVNKDGLTTTPGVYAVGDITPGHKQIPVAIGEGANTGIAIYLELREFPKKYPDS